jgi:hypothetical protein
MITEKKNKDGIVVWKINKPKKIYEYCFMQDCSQGKCIKQLFFIGYTKQPSSLNSNGYGFMRALKPFYFQLKDTFGIIDKIEIIDGGKTKISKQNKKLCISFSKDDYETLVSSCNEIFRENSSRLKEICYSELSKLFQKHFPQKSKTEYKKNTISEILKNENILDLMSYNDMKSISGIIPALMDKSSSFKQKILDKTLFIDIKNKANSIKFSQIIKEYEVILAKKTQNEAEWQKYLKNNMLFLNSSYLDLIEKKNISPKGSIPDFLLIDQFQFVDIFEIKRPDFKVIMYDKSHDNYFWSTETVKAISQVENYIFQIEENSSTLMRYFCEEGIDVKIIRPRGFVLIGKRTDLENKKSITAFRILNSSLKNVQVIFYDDFLESIKSKFKLLK